MRKRYIVSWMCFLGLCGCDLVYDYDPSQMYTVRKEACEMSVERATAAINVGVPGDRKVRYNGYFEYKLGRCSCRNELCQLGEVCNDYVTKDAASCVDYVCSDGVVVCSSTETGEGYLYRCENNNWVQPVRCLIGCAEDGKSCIDHQVVECDDGDRYCSEMNGQKAFWTCEDGGYIYETCHHGCDQANGCLHKNECTDGEQACVGELIKECVQGGWLAAHSCGEGRKCTENTCLSEGENVCDEGKYRCSHKEHKLELCQNNTWGAQDLDKCVVCKTGNSTNAKRFVLGESKEAVCEIFEEKVVCDGKNLMSCVNGKWEGPAECPNGCTEGKCIQCIEDECVNGNLHMCSEGEWKGEKLCEHGCTEGKCIQCIEDECVNGNLHMCSEGEWKGEKLCEHGCSNGKCNECTNGTFKCDSKEGLMKCENGTWGKTLNEIEMNCTCPLTKNLSYANIYKVCPSICVNNKNGIGYVHTENGGKKCEDKSCNKGKTECGKCKNGLFKCQRFDGYGIKLWTCEEGKVEEFTGGQCDMCKSYNGWGTIQQVCGTINPSSCVSGASRCTDKTTIEECISGGWMPRRCNGECENQVKNSNGNKIDVIEGVCLGEEHYECKPTNEDDADNNYPIKVMHLKSKNGKMNKENITDQQRQELIEDRKCLVCKQEKSKKVNNVVSGIDVGKTICISDINYTCQRTGNESNPYELVSDRRHCNATEN